MKIPNLFSNMAKATRTAFDRAVSVTGQETNPDLRIYQSLQPQDFDKIMQKFGPDQTLDYIKHMESVSMINKKGGPNA